MRWILQVEYAAPYYYVVAWVDGQEGGGYGRHRRFKRAVALAQKSYLADTGVPCGTWTL